LPIGVEMFSFLGTVLSDEIKTNQGGISEDNENYINNTCLI